MANKKISGFDDLRTTPLTNGDADVTYVDGFAAYGTNASNTPGVNVQLSGLELIASLEKNLDLSDFKTGILPVNRGGTGLTSITTLQNVNVNYASDGTGILPAANWLPAGGTTNQYIDYQGNWQTITTGSTYQAGNGIEFDTTTTPDTIKAKLKTNGGIEFQTGALALNLSATAITGTLKVLDGGTGLSAIGSVGDSIRINSTSTGFEYYTPTDNDTTYTLENLAASNLITLKDSTPSSAGQVQFTAGTGITLDNTTAGTITITNSSPNNPDSYGLSATTGSNPNINLLKNSSTPAGTVNIVGGSNVTVDGGTALPGTITISSTGGGGPEAFTTLTTDATSGEVEWDFANDGVNIELTPVAGKVNNIVMKNSTFPDNGSHGYLVLNPTNTTAFQLPPNSLILNGDVFPNGTNPTTYEYVYDGTNFYWEKQSNLVAPIYPPVNPFPVQNLIGVWDPETINPAFLLAGNPYDDSIVPDDPSNTNDIQINYGIGNGATWTNSYTVNNIIGDMTATSNPASSSSNYKPSFVKNDVGPLKEQTYDSTTTPPVLVPNPTSLASVVNTQAFYFQDLIVTGTGTYTTIGSDIEVQNGSIDVSRGAQFKITSDGTNITEIEVTLGGDGYSVGDLIQVDLSSSSIASGELYILVQGPMLDGIAAIQFGYPEQAEFGIETYNQSYGFSSTSFNTAQNNIKTIMMWVYGAFPDQSTYNCLFDCRDAGGDTDAEAMYINGTTGSTFLFSPTATFTNFPKWKDYSSGGGYNANNQWTFLVFTYFPNGNSSFVAGFFANQDTLDNKAPTSPAGTNINNWAYQGTLGTETVGVDEDGFCTQVLNGFNLDEDEWDDFHIGNSATENEGLRAKIGKFALYNAIVPDTSILQAFNASKGYYGLT